MANSHVRNGRTIRKVVAGLSLTGVALATPAAISSTYAAPPRSAELSSGVATQDSGSAAVGGVISTERQLATKSYWTAARMASAKPVMPQIKKSAAASTRPSNTKVTGSPVTVEPAAPRGATASSVATASAEVTSPAIYGRAYAYPAPFTRYETFPASSYNAFPNRVVGKLFFADGSGNGYVCSASVVNSENKDIVWTAGHCISNGSGSFYRNWAFVPARRLGANPYGVWTPREFWTRTEWHVNGNLRQDVGALVMRDNAGGTSIANAIGALGITFNGSRVRHWNAMGYPAASPFAGERQYQNQASYAASDTPTAGPGPDTIGAGNDLTGGSSGGPWIYRYSAFGGYVNGLNSYKYIVPSMPLEMYSPYLGAEALSLYTFVRNR
jgi:V8-like Glu-specific endopeptidase